MAKKKTIKKTDELSPIYQNALDSLRIGEEFFLNEDGYSSRKHAILTVSLDRTLWEIIGVLTS